MTKDMTDLTAQEFAEQNSSPSQWRGDPRGEFLLYLNARDRLRVTFETHENPAFGLDRLEALDAGDFADRPCSYDRDMSEFAAQFLTKFMNYLSLHDAQILATSLTAYVAQEEKEHASRTLKS